MHTEVEGLEVTGRTLVTVILCYDDRSLRQAGPALSFFLALIKENLDTKRDASFMD